MGGGDGGTEQVSLGHAFELAMVAVALGVLTVAGVAWGPRVVHLLRDTGPTPLQEAESWAEANLPTGARLVVDPTARHDLLAAGVPSDRLTPDSSLRAAPAGGTSWRAADYVVSTADVRSAGGGQLGSLLHNTVLVASFGDGDDRVEVREVAPDGLAASAARARRIAAVSADLGRQLLTSHAVSLRIAAARWVVAGEVDLRLLTVLVGLGRQHTLTVVDFVDPDPGGLFPAHFRAAVLDRVDGAPVVARGPKTAAVLEWLGVQRPPFRPSAVSVEPTGLVVRFRLLGPHEAPVL